MAASPIPAPGTTVYVIDDPRDQAVWCSLDGERFLSFSRAPETAGDIEVIRNAFEPRPVSSTPTIERDSWISPMTMARRGLSLILGLDLRTMQKMEV